MVWRWGLVVNESMVTRWLWRVEGISMSLETVRLPGENVLYREELERWGVVVQSLRQNRLHHFFIFFKPLRYACRGRHGVLERRLVQPRYSVRNLRNTQVHQRGPGRSLSLGRVDLVRSLRSSYSLPEEMSSEMALLESTSNAALKLSGDSSHAVDSTEEDLESGERDLESLDSLWFLAHLTGVLGGLTGVLACLSASLARLTRRMEEPLWRLGSSFWRSSRLDWSPVGWVMSGSR